MKACSSCRANWSYSSDVKTYVGCVYSSLIGIGKSTWIAVELLFCWMWPLLSSRNSWLPWLLFNWLVKSTLLPKLSALRDLTKTVLLRCSSNFLSSSMLWGQLSSMLAWGKLCVTAALLNKWRYWRDAGRYFSYLASSFSFSCSFGKFLLSLIAPLRACSSTEFLRDAVFRGKP